MKATRGFLMLAMLVIGGALGYMSALLLTDVPVPAATAPRSPTAVARTIANAGGDSELQVLRARVRELERRLAEKDAATEGEKENAAAEAGGDEMPPHESFRDRLARLEKEDPARYAQITNRMEQGRLRHLARQQARLDFLASIDTSRMGEKARQVHEDLQEAIVARDALEQKLHDPNLTEAQRRQLMDEMHQLDRQTNQLNQRERNNLMLETAKALGIKGTKTKAFMSTMRDILDATSGGGGRHGGPPGQPPGR